jgi:hypothetical protein
MSDEKHTPGRMGVPEFAELIENVRRNEYLYAAAPEMLAMLKECHLHLEAVYIDEDTRAAGLWQGEMIPRMLERLSALIAKAEGNVR